ncbi:hypothetical protein [Mycobacterium sp.]|uniref:hypothetical protein n=1 Tax=Mycobacterium sp. TaxID=1785 RepID=UPI0031DBB14D
MLVRAASLGQFLFSCEPEDLSLAYEIHGTSVTTDSGRCGEMPRFVLRGESDISVQEILGTGGESDAMRRVVDFVDNRNETDAQAVVTARLAKSTKLASQILRRLHRRGLIDHPKHGLYGPLSKRRKDIK